MDGNGRRLSGAFNWNGGAHSNGVLGFDVVVYNRSNFWYNIDSFEKEDYAKSGSVRTVHGGGMFFGSSATSNFPVTQVLARPIFLATTNYKSLQIYKYTKIR